MNIPTLSGALGFDLIAARARVRRLAYMKRIKGIYKILLPFTAHLGSIVTILAAWFMRSGSFVFHVEDRKDWIVALVLLVIAVSGSVLIIRQFTIPEHFVVSRRELSDLVAVARADAEVSVTNVGGNLTWLEDDFDSLKALRRDKPNVTVKIYCNRSSVPARMADLVRALSDVGIEFISYPPMVVPQIKCMLIDKSNQDSLRVYAYSRHGISGVGVPREEHQFLWESFSRKSSSIINAVIAFENVVESLKTEPIRVGITGLNNVGKTTLATKLFQLLNVKTPAKLYRDEFRTAEKITFEDNCLILFSQFGKEIIPEADINVYDRTLVDNLCFLRVRLGKNDAFYHELAPQVASVAKRFDLIIDIDSKFDAGIKATKLVTATDRKLVRKTLNDFFSNHGITKLTINDTDLRSETEMDKAVNQIAEQVMSIYRMRGLNQ